MVAVTNRAMKLRMLGVCPRDYIDYQTLRQISGVKDIVVVTKESKICSTGMSLP